MLIHSFPQIIKSAVFIEIDFSNMGIHQGDELRGVHTKTRDDGRNFFILRCCHVVGEVIAERAVRVNLYVAALDVMQENLGDPLIFL